MEHCSEAGEAVEPTVGLPSPTRTLLQVGDPAGARAGQDGRPVICNPSPALWAVVSLPHLLTVGSLPPVGWGGGEWGGGESSSLTRPVRRGPSEHHASLSSTQLSSPLSTTFQASLWEGRVWAGKGSAREWMESCQYLHWIVEFVSKGKPMLKYQESSGQRGLVRLEELVLGPWQQKFCGQGHSETARSDRGLGRPWVYQRGRGWLLG